jgi:hypothetical protein
VSWDSGPRLIIQEGSDVATRPSAPNPTSPPRRALVLTCALRLWTTPRLRSELQCLHVSHGPPWSVDSSDRERLSYNGMQQVSCVSKTRPRVTKVHVRRAGKWCYHDLQTMWTGATASCYSASPCNLPLVGMPLQCSATQLTAHGNDRQRLRPVRMGLCCRPLTTWQDRRDEARHAPHVPSLVYDSN